jgi:hypothetical protein
MNPLFKRVLFFIFFLREISLIIYRGMNMAKNQSSKYSKEFLDKTIKVWQPYNPTPLTLNDAREITDNITALFNLLINNDGKLKGKEK